MRRFVRFGSSSYYSFRSYEATPRLNTVDRIVSLQSVKPKSSNFDRRVLLAGILGMLGFNHEEKEEEDPITSTVKSAILSIQVEPHAEIITIWLIFCVLRKKGDFVKADRLLHVALQQAQVSGRADAVTHIYSLMANLAMERKLFKQAEQLFTTVLKRLLR